MNDERFMFLRGTIAGLIAGCNHNDPASTIELIRKELIRSYTEDKEEAFESNKLYWAQCIDDLEKTKP